MKDLIMLQIKGLIDLGYEGDYWDFKREWYPSNANLLHDILCMCNVIHNGDRYIIIGVENDGRICGVENDPNRKTQEQLIDFLNNKKFSINYRPHISAKTVTIEDKILDIIVIGNSSRKPYYLEEQYSKDGIIVRANNIYTRVGPINTSKDKQCPQYLIEEMWRERFGLSLTTFERLKNLLSEPHEWEKKEDGSNEYHYHKYFPEFKIVFEDCDFEEEDTSGTEPYRYFYTNPKIAEGVAKFYYHSTVLIELVYVMVDGLRKCLPRPGHWPSKEYGPTYSYIKDEFNYLFLTYLTSPPMDCIWQSPSIFFNRSANEDIPFLIFQSLDDRNNFIDFLDDPKNKSIIDGLNVKTNVLMWWNVKKIPYIVDTVNKLCKVRAAYDYWKRLKQ